MSSVAVELRGISVRFGSFVALHDVSLKVAAGTIHAIVGENGAGKTTLMKVLQGMQPPASGEILLDGEPASIHSARDAQAKGIGMVSQHYSIVPELTCVQNLMLGAEPSLILDQGKAIELAKELASRLGFSFEWTDLAESLSPADSQKLEILKLLWRRARIMILDEPTAMLSPIDSDSLFENLQKLAAEGTTILVVTHRLPEVLRFCNDVTVLRGGELIGAKPVAETSSDELAELIIGRKLETQVRNEQPAIGATVLSVKGLTVCSDRGHQAVTDVALELRAGEIVGLAGVDGNGQKELFQALVGVRPWLQGSGDLGGRPIQTLSVADRIGQGLRLIPEDRHTEGVIEDWSLIENAALGFQNREEANHSGRLELATRIQQRFSTKASSLRNPMRSLSGGNQQRFVAGRAFEFEPKVILAFQPARGLDLQGIQAVYQALRAAVESGATALVAGFDLDELLEHCDRIVVMNHGRILEPAPDQHRDRIALGKLMVAA